MLDERLHDDFDVAVIMLGNNYGADPGVFEEYLRDIVEQLDPRPIVLSTVSVFQANRVEVNDVIYEIAQDFDNVRVLDWAGETAEYPVLTAGDGLHLTDLGRARFADMVAEELGDAPGVRRGRVPPELVHGRLGRHGEHRPDRGSGDDAAERARRTRQPDRPEPGDGRPLGTGPDTTDGGGDRRARR